MTRKNILALLPVLLLTSASASWGQARLTNEHVDLRINFSAPTTFDLRVSDDDNGILYSPSAVVLDVLPAAQVSRPASSAFDFIGVGAGQTYWRLPQNQNPNLLYLGVSGGGVSSSDIDSYDPSAESGGRVTGTGAWVKLSLESVTGPSGAAAPGFFSTWQNGDSGPNPFMSSFSGGVTSDDALWVVAGGHSHFNWGFSAPGSYEVTFRPSVRRSGSTVTSATPFTVLFDVTGVSVPEPGTLSLVVLPLLGLFCQRRRGAAKES